MHTKPPITESESHELALDSYVMYLNLQTCATCGATEKWSQIYEVWLHPTKTRLSNFKDLRPISGPLKPSLSIAALQTRAKSIALCSHCVPYIPKVTGHRIIASSAEWEETLKRKYAAPAAQEPRVAKRTTPQRAVPTLDEL